MPLAGSGRASGRGRTGDLRGDGPPAVGSRGTVPRAHLLRAGEPRRRRGGGPARLLERLLRVPRRSTGRRGPPGGDGALLQLRACLRRPPGPGGLERHLSGRSPAGATRGSRRSGPAGAGRGLAGVAVRRLLRVNGRASAEAPEAAALAATAAAAVDLPGRPLAAPVAVPHHAAR